MVEVGDIIKFAELAWVVVDYGWSPDLNANRQYLEFGRDVEHLAHSLEDLTGVIDNARQSFRSRRVSPPALTFGWDRNTLLEIVGDFDATLRECYLLITTNKSYAAASGPVRNVRWNALVMPSVDRLRNRILMHNSKIQHFLRPFEIDLHLRIHDDLARRIENAHVDIRAAQADIRVILRDMQALKRQFEPSSQMDAEQPSLDAESDTITPPPETQDELERLFALHPDRDLAEYKGPLLQDIGDAFIRNFNLASPLFESNEARVEEAGGTEEQYIALLTCQFLMAKMVETEEFLEAPPISHWPRHVRNLQQQLRNACSHFNRSMMADSFADGTKALQVPPIWEEEQPAPYIESATLPAAMEQVLEIPLKIDTPRRWRKMKLFRYCDGSDRRFRLLITAGNVNQPAAETRPVDFDLATATLTPRYASPDEKEPLEMILKPGEEMFRLEFCCRADLYLFQQAVTGYEVVDEYMPYRVQTIFVIDGSNELIKEYASLQLWKPARLDGDNITEDVDTSDDEIPGSFSRTPTLQRQEWATAARVEYATSRWPIPGVLRAWHTNSSTASNVAPRHSASFSARLRQSQPQPASRRSTWGETWGTVSGTASRISSGSRPTQPFAFPGRTSTTASSSSRQQQQEPTRMPSVTSLSSNSSSSSTTVRQRGRQGSFSTQSINSTMTSASRASTQIVNIGGGPNVATMGTLHCKPTEPMLVLFTRSLGETGVYGIVAVTLDQRVKPNYEGCQCTWTPTCPVIAVEAGDNGSNGGPLPVLRLGGVEGGEGRSVRWDILSLAESMKGRRSVSGGSGTGGRDGRAWQRVIRVTMRFETIEKRMEFGGMPCACTARVEGELMACLTQGHRGRLGVVRESFRREMVEWYNRRYRDPVNVVDQPGRLSARND